MSARSPYVAGKQICQRSADREPRRVSWHRRRRSDHWSAAAGRGPVGLFLLLCLFSTTLPAAQDQAARPAPTADSAQLKSVGSAGEPQTPLPQPSMPSGEGGRTSRTTRGAPMAWWTGLTGQRQSTVRWLVCGALLIAAGAGIVQTWNRRQPRPSGQLSPGVVEWLGQTTLDDKTRLQLIRFGSRLLLVSQQGDRMETLSEVADPTEAAAILAACRREGTGGVTLSAEDWPAPKMSPLPGPAEHAAPKGRGKFFASVLTGLLLWPVGLLSHASQAAPIEPAKPASEATQAEAIGPTWPAEVDPTAAGHGDMQADVFWSWAEGAVDSARFRSMMPTLAALVLAGLIPILVLLTTGFIRISIVLALLRQAMGGAQIPSNQVLMSVSILLTVLLMLPVWEQVYREAWQPYLEQKDAWTLQQACEQGLEPLHRFMSRQIQLTGNTDEVWLFLKHAGPSQAPPQTYEQLPIRVLLPAFVLSELKTAFLIGFQLYLPFLVVDLLVATFTTSMGLASLPNQSVALPLKMMLFVLTDGWHLVVDMLLNSFAPL